MIPTLPTNHPIPHDRPTWAKLPEQTSRAYGRPRPTPGLAGLAQRVGELVSGGDRRRKTIMATVLVMVLVVLGTTWWVTVGRYTDAPPLVAMTKSAAETAARQGGFGVFYAPGAYSETVPKDVVLSQDPAGGQQIERYPVPPITGKELAAAKAELDNVKLKLKQGDKQYSDSVPEGAVISTDPPQDTSLKPGDTVTVVISKGRAPIIVPDLTHKNINDARAQLQALGLREVEQYKDSDQPGDTVIGQNPKADTGAQKGDEITLDVSKGPALVIVPRVIDVPCDQAQQQLRQLGLQPRIGVLPTGLVRSQNPAENTQVGPNTEVQLQCF
jgi:serine/threonine-protein kinase